MIAHRVVSGVVLLIGKAFFLISFSNFGKTFSHPLILTSRSLRIGVTSLSGQLRDMPVLSFQKSSNLFLRRQPLYPTELRVHIHSVSR